MGGLLDSRASPPPKLLAPPPPARMAAQWEGGDVGRRTGGSVEGLEGRWAFQETWRESQLKILSRFQPQSFWWNSHRSHLKGGLITCPHLPPHHLKPTSPCCCFSFLFSSFVLHKCAISSLRSWERKPKFGAKWQRELRLSWREHWYWKHWRPLCAHFGKVEQWLSPELALMDLQQSGLKRFIGLDVYWCMCVEGEGVCVFDNDVQARKWALALAPWQRNGLIINASHALYYKL